MLHYSKNHYISANLWDKMFRNRSEYNEVNSASVLTFSIHWTASSFPRIGERGRRFLFPTSYIMFASFPITSLSLAVLPCPGSTHKGIELIRECGRPTTRRYRRALGNRRLIGTNRGTSGSTFYFICTIRILNINYLCFHHPIFLWASPYMYCS